MLDKAPAVVEQPILPGSSIDKPVTIRSKLFWRITEFQKQVVPQMKILSATNVVQIVGGGEVVICSMKLHEWRR